MPFKLELTQLDGLAAVRAVSETLRRIDARLINHGDRVAFIACELQEAGKLPLDPKKLFLLSVFHDIGAYKTDEIDRMVEFETHDVWNHSIYGYLFLKYMTPLRDMAESVLHHHTPWRELSKLDSAYRDYAALIELADRIDILVEHSTDSPVLDKLLTDTNGVFRPDYVSLFFNCCQERNIYAHLKDQSFQKKNTERVLQFNISPEEALEYLKMIVYSIDFRSEFTVTHTINTVSLALNFAQYLNLASSDIEKIYLGALLHDVGKISIPIEILENPGRLTDAQMEIMRTHVVQTETLIRGIVPDDICLIAIRHHEKLDGSGYPYQLTGKDLTLPQRVVAVADIVSALASKRSYKDAFPKEKTIAILQKMKQNQLDSVLCEYVCDNYDDILQQTTSKRQVIIEKYQAITSEFEAMQQRFHPVKLHL